MNALENDTINISRVKLHVVRSYHFCSHYLWSHLEQFFGKQTSFFDKVGAVLMDYCVVLSICCVSAFLLGCRSEARLSGLETRKPFVPGYQKTTEFQLPTYKPCPDGWNISELDVGNNYIIEYCDPPLPPDSNHDPSVNALSPLTPAPPNFLPCPQGWTEWVDERDVVVNRNGQDERVKRITVTCNPYPDDEARNCGSIDKIHFIGEPGCSQIGTECPHGEDKWATNIVDSREIVYVKAAAPAGGSGTKQSPYGSINEAIAQEERNVVIALSKGVFDENVTLQEGITLWGACVAETILLGSQESTEESVVQTTAPETEVRNLQITGNRLGVVAAGGSASLHLEDVVIFGVYHNGINLSNHAQLSARNIVVRDMLKRSSNQDAEAGLLMTTGADGEITRSIFQNNAGSIGGIHARDNGTTLKLHDVVVRDTIFGGGIDVRYNAEAEIKRVLSLRNITGMGVLRGAIATIEDVVIRDGEPHPESGWGGNGMYLGTGANVEIKRILLQNNRTFGIKTESGITAKIEDIVLRDMHINVEQNAYGWGLVVYGPSDVVEVNRGMIRDCFAQSISTGKDTYVRLTDVVVQDSQNRPTRRARGVDIGSKAEFVRTVIQHTVTYGIWAASGAILKLEDVVVRDVRPNFNQEDSFGRGLELHSANVEIVRSVFQNNRDLGIFAGVSENSEDVPSSLTLDHVIVRDTQSSFFDGTFGRGLEVQSGSDVNITKSVFENNADIGIIAAGQGTQVNLEDSIVFHTQQKQCALESKPTCTNQGNGMGVVSHGGAIFALKDFALYKNNLCGAQIAFGDDESELSGIMSMSDGILSGNNVCGINVQVDDARIEDFTHNVLYYNNNYNNIDSVVLPMPDISKPMTR